MAVQNSVQDNLINASKKTKETEKEYNFMPTAKPE